MKYLILAIVFSSISFTKITAQETYTLTIDFTGIKSNKGAVYIGIQNKKVDFLKKHFKNAIVKISNKKATVFFKGLPKGEYAVSAFHDENENGKMDTNFIGIPKEPIGISNDAKGFMGPPKYENAKFMITQDKQISIKLNSFF